VCQRIDLGDGNFAIVCGGRRAHRRPSVKLPATRDEVEAGGWRKVEARRCKLCGVPIDIFRTLLGKNAPLEEVLVDGVRKYISHFATCPHANKFRTPKHLKPAKPEVPKTGDLFA